MTHKPLVAITGASSGIGAATARAFSKAGHPVLMMARRTQRMHEMKGEIAHGPIDMMFVNAGIARLADIGRQPPEEWDEMIDINTKGVMNTVHAVMQGMMERRHGTIFMMSSIAGRKVYPDHTVYCGTKYFVHAVSESLRDYLSDYNVRVIVLSPGVIETEVLSGVLDQQTLADYKANKIKMGGGISAEIVADLILNAYNYPQEAIVQEICITPTRQKF